MSCEKTSTNDSSLIAKLKQDCNAALTEIRNRWGKTLHIRANRILQDPTRAKDVVQGVLIKLWEIRNSLPNNTKLHAYLQEAVKNRCLNIQEQQRTLKSQPCSNIDGIFEIPDNISDPIIVKETETAAWQAINKLPEAQKRVITLAIGGSSYKEISEKTDTSVHTVRNNLAAARKTLRKKLRGL